MNPFPSLMRTVALVATSAVLLAGPAWAADGPAAADAQARFQSDMALCNSGRSNQGAATCRIEAKSALAAARRGNLNDAPGQYERNALKRCDVFDGSDRTDCVARMRGEGASTQGSAQGGGILRMGVTVVPAE
ncbi:MAG: hypothetical protein Q8K38_06145 [Burkholderiaceae bacterium]|uniref:hypothetical protein n=1 Tax=Hydrogenophaga sp. TaxID=1904254 RepID=UPI002779C7A9|nr:hypothetical protein [Hydrogenophaga sp.]MDP2065538.1 hypothetical protein [Burkholderiaceae bacterium]MDZ4143723.1 hypothetical protein [Burkholderiales bacterium]MDZ4397700.1 hypothetical protein [Hydrogenophaga sp.]